MSRIEELTTKCQNHKRAIEYWKSEEARIRYQQKMDDAEKNGYMDLHPTPDFCVEYFEGQLEQASRELRKEMKAHA